MSKLIIYDLDGTLIDSRRDIVQAVNWTLEQLGFSTLPSDRICTFVGNGVKNLMQQVLTDVGAGPCACPESVEDQRIGQPRGVAPTLEKSIKLFRQRYGEHLLDETRLYPAVAKVLEFFKQKKQAVITNKPEDFSVRILQGLGIDSYFFSVVGGDNAFRKKPAPEAVFEILRRAEVSRENAVLVGDTDIDVQTGRNAGIKTIGVTYGFGKSDELKKAEPDYLLNDLEELITCPLLQTR